MKYIDVDTLKLEITNLCTNANLLQQKAVEESNKEDFVSASGEIFAYTKVLSLINSLQQEQPNEQPEYGYLHTEYVHGKKSRWSIGDVLAYYISTSNEEGEYLLGKIVNVEFDKEDGWVYAFEDESMWDEQSLVEEGVYKIIENGK